MENLKNKILGSFAGLAIGDALGMPFHELTPEEISKRCGGLAKTFYPISDDEFIHLDYKAGQVTDDTILTMVTARAIIKHKGHLSADQFVFELADWVKNNKPIWQHGNVFGPSTKVAFNHLLNGNFRFHSDRTRNWCYTGTSNGSLMRVSPAGWANPGKIEKSVELACAVILPTHPTDVALSAAGGQAAAIAEALTPNASVNSIVEAMFKGAQIGEEIGNKVGRIVAQRYPLPSLEIALNLAEKAQDPFESASLIRKTIGSHLHASETLATVLGIFYAAKGDFDSSIFAAVNNGGDTDTIASITGALCGAFKGISSVPANMINTVKGVNRIDFETLATEMAALSSN